MDVSSATIRRALCWGLLLAVIPIGSASSQPETNPRAVTGKITLPEEIAHFLGAPTSVRSGPPGEEAADVQLASAPPAGAENDPAAPAATSQAVSGKISVPPAIENSPPGAEAPSPEPGAPGPLVTAPPAPVAQQAPAPAVAESGPPAAPTAALAIRPEAGAPAGAAARDPAPPPLPSLFAADREKLKNAYSYNPAGKIDPFEPLFKAKPEETEKVQKKQRPKRVPRTPLEMVDISQLKLSAIIMAASGDRALVEEASGKGYVVRVGTPIGVHWGKIATIEKDRLIVEEEVEDLMGDYVKRKREMKLNKPIGE